MISTAFYSSGPLRRPVLAAALIAWSAATLAVAQSQPAPLEQPAAISDQDTTSAAPTGDDLSATLTESDEEGFASPPVGAAAPKKPAVDPCAAAIKSVFYDNDFSYLDDPNFTGHCLGDCWKHMPVDRCGRYGTLDLGGQLRLRYHHEIGMGQDQSGPGLLRFEDTEHDFLLSRVRLYTNWKANDATRVYVEGIFADVTDDGGTYLPRPIDRNFGDFLNAFVDYAPSDELTLRVGRQELLYGAERLMSPLDWANTRRTFEGVKLMLAEGDWKIDGFYTHLVPVIPNRLDEADYDQPVYGVYSTYAGWKDKTLDLYYIGYDNNNVGDPIVTDFSLSTLGSRLYGSRGNWLYEIEGGVQTGRQSGLRLDQDAGFATAGLGRKYPRAKWTPTIWVYYDYASGNFPGGDFNRFNPLFPLGHKYFGFIDAVQRSNIESPNVLVTMKPHKQWDLLMWYWHFLANSASDIVPSIGGTPIQNTSRSHFGDELDLTAKYAISPRSGVLFGYSHFWRGDKILAPRDADFFYTQWEVNF